MTTNDPEPITAGGQQIRLLVTHTMPDKSTSIAMMKDKKGWMFPIGNYSEDTKSAAVSIAQSKLKLTIAESDWTIIDGGETTLLGTKLTGDFLPAMEVSSENNVTAEWIPLETALKIMQMPKVVNPFHADQRIITTCAQWYPRLAKRVIGVTPTQRA